MENVAKFLINAKSAGISVNINKRLFSALFRHNKITS